MQLRVFVGPIYFKDNLKTIEAQFPKKLRTTEAHFEFTGPYKKKSVYLSITNVMSCFTSALRFKTKHA